MTQSTPEDSDKKEAASFFTKWMNCNENKEFEVGNWDEVCLQWCKQKDTARKDQTDPSCTMYCFRRPLLKGDDEQSVVKKPWNPLAGYSITVINGKEECATHVDDMKKFKKSNVESLDEKLPVPSRYELDLGNIWTEAKGRAKYVLDEKMTPLYNSTLEQAREWKKSPEAQQMRDYAKQQADRLYSQVFKTSPPSVNATPSSEAASTPKSEVPK